jgi:hypothetical protein
MLGHVAVIGPALGAIDVGLDGADAGTELIVERALGGAEHIDHLLDVEANAVFLI